MDNKYLRSKNANQIDLAIEKVIYDLGNPEPPLDLSKVRRRLSLDLEYYTSTNESLLKDVVHGAKMGGLTLFEKVMQLGEAIRKWEIKALFRPDERRILIDKDQPRLKWRWSEAHEIAHSLIKWHGPLMTFDTSVTLSPDCILDMEHEANFGAGRLLFLQDKFLHDARSVAATLQSVFLLAKRYGNTNTSTLWRFVESLDIPVFAMVGYHPVHHIRPSESLSPCRYFVRSKQFFEGFSKFSDLDAVAIFESYCTMARGGPLGSRIALIDDDNGDAHEFLFDSFNNTHEVLTIATYVGKKKTMIAVGEVQANKV